MGVVCLDVAVGFWPVVNCHDYEAIVDPVYLQSYFDRYVRVSLTLVDRTLKHAHQHVLESELVEENLLDLADLLHLNAELESLWTHCKSVHAHNTRDCLL